MRLDDTKLSPLASTDLFHPNWNLSRYWCVVVCFLFVCVLCGLFLLVLVFVLFLLLVLCVSVLFF